jgi:type II secretory pathway component PulJ
MRRSQRGIVLFEVLIAAAILALASVLMGRVIVDAARRVEYAHQTYEATLRISEPLWLFERAERLGLIPSGLDLPTGLTSAEIGSSEALIEKILAQRPLRISWPKGSGQDSLQIGLYKRHES